MRGEPVLSIVAPVHNEQGNLQELHRRLRAVLDPMALEYEILFVDDGSQDGSVEVIESLVSTDAAVRLIELSRNFGKEMAMLAGYDHARGRAVVVIDADLQTPPDVIPEMVRKWRAGAEIVDAIRSATVGQGRMRAAASSVFYWLMSKLGKTDIVPDCVDFRLLDQSVVRELRNCRERFRFNRGLVGWLGFRRQSVTFVAGRRHAGTSRWGLFRLAGYAMDAIFSFSSVPLRIAGVVGLIVSALSFVYLAALVIDNLIRGLPIPGYATLVGGIFLLGGVELLCMWMLGEYIGRLYEEAKARPPYVVRRVVQAGADPQAPPEHRSAANGTRTGQNRLP